MPNNYSSSRTLSASYKGFNGMLKGIVMATDTDTGSDGSGRIKVLIPSYHGKNAPTDSLPWVQVCAPILRDSDKGIQKFFSFFHRDGDSSGDEVALRPKVGDTVWLTFEGGDIRYPVYMGILSTDGNMKPGSTYATGSMGSSTYTVAGGSIADLTMNIISAYEGDYDTIVGNDNGAVSIGKIGWHADRAKNLLISIRERDSSKFESIINKNGAQLFQKQCLVSSYSWASYKMTQGSSTYNATKEILQSQASHDEQDDLIRKDVNGYLDAGRKQGLTDTAALMFYADCYNQSPAAANRVAKQAVAKGGTLEDIYNAAMSDPTLGKYNGWNGRRTGVYNQIKGLRDKGELSPRVADLTATGSYPLTGPNVGKLMWPTPGCKVITSPYGYRNLSGQREFHKGIDIAKNGSALGQPIYACMDANVVTAISYGSCGKHVILSNSSMGISVIHMHMNDYVVKSGQTVKMGDLLGYVGNTGNSFGAHLHFEIHSSVANDRNQFFSTSHVDPMKYLSNP